MLRLNNKPSAALAIAGAALALAWPAAPALAQVGPSAQSAAPAAKPGARAPAEAQLQAIRDALIDKAMGSNTRVSTTAWLNERGELMEANQFRTDMQVRGVRVLEYVDGETPQAVVNVAGPDAPAPQEAACRDPMAGDTWRHPLRLRMLVDPPQDPQWAGVTAQAAHWVEWGLRNRAKAAGGMLEVWASETLPRNRYEEAVYGMVQPRAPMGLTVRVRMVTGLEDSHPKARAERWESRARQWLDWGPPQRQSMTLRLDWQLSRAGEAPILQQHSTVAVFASAEQRPSRLLEEAARVAVLQEVGARWMVLQDVLDCEPLVVEARAQTDGMVALMAGHDAGLRVGDRLVLVDGRHVPRRLLEAEAAPHMALLEVQQVQGQRSQARQVAGPRLPQDGSGNWLAMPFGATLLAKRPEVTP